MLSNSGPVFFRKPGLFFGQGADRVSTRTAGLKEPAARTCHNATGVARHDARELEGTTAPAGRGLSQRFPLSPRRHGRDDLPKQKNAGF